MIELLSPQEMAEADRLTIVAGTAGLSLMERAGAAVAAAARRCWRGGPILVLAGPGNNGGDGFVAARLLRHAGFRVTVGLLGRREDLRGDAAAAAASFAGIVLSAEEAVAAGAGLVVDALVGAGIRLPLRPEAERLVEAVNVMGVPVVAVDLPTGVSGATGEIAGAAVRATETVTFFRLKPGHLLLPGRLHCGRVTVADIGIGAGVLAAIAPKTHANRPPLWLEALARPDSAGHKYSRGHVLVVSGPATATGAARLSAGAALRIGAGLVTVASPPEAAAANAAHLTAVMVRVMEGEGGLADLLSDQRRNAVVAGPGMGTDEGAAALLSVVLQGGQAAVLDADVLTILAGHPPLLTALRQRQRVTVLTPHEGEFRRLFPGLDGDKLTRARQAAAATGAVVVLKGADTVVAAPDGQAAIADNAPATLATAGSGDVLAGMVAGLLAQGMPAFSAAAAAVWMHGEAAALFGPGLISEDLADLLPQVLSGLTGRSVAASPAKIAGPARRR